eukprot:7012260-Prymnesium_polylepis.1
MLGARVVSRASPLGPRALALRRARSARAGRARRSSQDPASPALIVTRCCPQAVCAPVVACQ